jgi:hypothetical protein
MKKVILFAAISAFAFSTMFAQQSTGATPAPAKKENKPKTEVAKDTTKKEAKPPVKKVPAKKKSADSATPKK